MYKIYCELRDLKGVKDADVVNATGITKSTFSEWKKGKYMPKIDKLKKIADYFGVSLEYLTTGKDDRFSDENIDLDIMLLTNDNIRTLVERYNKLNDEKKDMLIKYLELLEK